MNRRKLIQTLGLASTHALFPSILAGFVSSCQDPAYSGEDYDPVFFSREELETVGELIDVILPATRSGSASQVYAHHFLDEVFFKCLDAAQQASIREGLALLFPAFRSAGDKLELLTEVDQKAYAGEPGYAYFRTIKQYALVGFFTSQEGTTIASNYVKVPGDYKGEIESDENTLNYGNTGLRFYL